jgi:hypothetical protein
VGRRSRSVVYRFRDIRSVDVRAAADFTVHYHTERNHQGLDNMLICPDPVHVRGAGPVKRRERVAIQGSCFNPRARVRARPLRDATAADPAESLSVAEFYTACCFLTAAHLRFCAAVIFRRVAALNGFRPCLELPLDRIAANTMRARRGVFSMTSDRRPFVVPDDIAAE